MTTADPEALVEQVADQLITEAPELVPVVIGSLALQGALADLKGALVAELRTCRNPALLGARLGEIGRAVVSAAPAEHQPTLERLLARAVQMIVVARGGQVVS